MKFCKKRMSKDKYAKQLFEWQQVWKNENDFYKNMTDTEVRKLKKKNSKSILLNKYIDGEKWKTIPNFTKNNYYKASNFGRIKFNKIIVPQKEGGEKGLILDKEKFEKMYPKAKNNFDKNYSVHDMVAIVFCGKLIDDGLHVHHINDNEYDNSINNLVVLSDVEHSIIHSRPIFVK